MPRSSLSAATVARVGVAVVALACGISVWIVAHGSATLTTYAGRSQLSATLFVAAGFGLIVAGLAGRWLGRLVPGLSIAAGFAWFAPVWEGWEGGPAFLRAVAMPVGRLVFPLLVHVVLVAAMVTVTRSATVLIVATYALAGILAVWLMLVRDPYLDPHCF